MDWSFSNHGSVIIGDVDDDEGADAFGGDVGVGTANADVARAFEIGVRHGRPIEILRVVSAGVHGG